MKIYDQAHRLAKEISESSEYRSLLQAQEKVKRDEATHHMVQDFRMKQFELQAAQITGQDNLTEKEEQIEKLYQVISMNNAVRELLEAEYHFNKLYTDIIKIITDAIKDSIDMEQQ